MKNYGSEWKRRLKAGEFIHGGHIFLPNPAMAEAMAFFGYQYLWIDGEHGAYDKEALLAHITAINGAGAGAIVRVTANEPALLKPVLEMGPDGIIVPMVNSPEEAAAFVSACTYPPKGTRGFGPRRANRYGTLGDPDYLSSVDESLVKIVQIEHKKGVENIDSILEVPGIDSVVIGPYDLSGSLGILGQLTHPDMLAACRRIVERCKAHHIPCGPSIGSGNQEFLRFWLDQKTDFIFCGDDLGFVKAGAESTIARVRELRR
ncbi:MAG: aldolase/citrate lyase family protein [Treponema sp.]|nr:aldolase/citrate lyase family protein [Treponema sp.]